MVKRWVRSVLVLAVVAGGFVTGTGDAKAVLTSSCGGAVSAGSASCTFVLGGHNFRASGTGSSSAGVYLLVRILDTTGGELWRCEHHEFSSNTGSCSTSGAAVSTADDGHVLEQLPAGVPLTCVATITPHDGSPGVGAFSCGTWI